MRDLESRSQVLASSMEQTLAELFREKKHSQIEPYLKRIQDAGRIYAIGICDPTSVLRYKTATFPPTLKCFSKALTGDPISQTVDVPTGMLQSSVFLLQGNSGTIGKLVFLHDMSFVAHRSAETRRYMLYLFVIVGLLISLVTVVVAQLSWRELVFRLRKSLRAGNVLKGIRQLRGTELAPLAKDLRALMHDIENDRRSRDESQMNWTPISLKQILKEDLSGDEVLIVANREPYSHNKKGDKIEIQTPASGLVTALEPILRACSGTWIAHGSGTADRQTVDKFDHVKVPPDNPSYEIRRVWLTKEEEAGYYYGFSNEGLWPLCHIAHTRPTFRLSDWKAYVEVNKKFARAVIEEAKTDDPVILVQDYHFALLPKMVREELPDATIITFWHIPWPNPEAFGICPWYEEILQGLLGSSILGFHTRFHCNNFVDSVDRFLEARIDRETSTISFGQKLTAVKHYPISIEWPLNPNKTKLTVSECRDFIRKENALPPDRRLAMGVDRLDYTKGILERFLWVDSLLTHHPEWLGKFSLIQIAAPSRSKISHYQDFEAQVRALASEINSRHGFDGYEPILLKIEHHDVEKVFQYYRGCDVCVVSSLHDGMNLVAKEFVAGRDDNEGVLILSQFTGAARELPEALIVNPYNIDQGATALHIALEMPVTEQRARMRAMRNLIQEFNVYRWAGRMLMDAAFTRRKARLKGRMRDSETSLLPSSIFERSTFEPNLTR